MSSINNNLHPANDDNDDDLNLNLLPLPPLQPSSATTFSTAAVQRVLQATKGTLFAGASSSYNMAPLPFAPARIWCIPCLLHDKGLDGYSVCTFQQLHGAKCKKYIHPFYLWYCTHLRDNNLAAPPFGTIPLEYQSLLELPRDVGIAADSTVPTMIGNVPVPQQLSDEFYSQLSLNMNKLIKESIEEKLSSQSSTVVSLPVASGDVVDDDNTSFLEEPLVIGLEELHVNDLEESLVSDTSVGITSPIGTRSKTSAPSLKYKF